LLARVVCRLGFSLKWLMVFIANFCRDKSATYIKNLIQGFVALATAAKEGLPLTPLWTLSAHPSITLNPSNHN